MPRKKQTTGAPVQAAAAKRTKARKPKASTKATPRATKKAKACETAKTPTVTENPVSEKHAGGRPSEYIPQYAHVARLMCANGATDAELADAFGVTVVTIWRWQATHSEFCNALSIAKGEYDDRIERSLAQRALGYTFDAVRIFMPANAETPVHAPYREHVPPDPGACKLWLCNRRPEKWRDRKELTGADGAPLVPIMNVQYGSGS